MVLFDKLPNQTKERLEQEFAQIQLPSDINIDVSLGDFLTEHRNDFIDWRYLDRDVNSLAPVVDELQLAV